MVLQDPDCLAIVVSSLIISPDSFNFCRFDGWKSAVLFLEGKYSVTFGCAIMERNSLWADVGITYEQNMCHRVCAEAADGSMKTATNISRRLDPVTKVKMSAVYFRTVRIVLSMLTTNNVNFMVRYMWTMLIHEVQGFPCFQISVSWLYD